MNRKIDRYFDKYMGIEGFIDIVRYIYISVFKLHILLKKIITYNYTKHIVSRLMTILSSQNS